MAIRPIAEIELFPVIQTPEQYKQLTGQECPAFNPAMPPKRWFDPSPTTGTYDVLELDDTGKPTRTPDNTPIIVRMSFGKTWAGKVNIPSPGATNEAGADQVQVPTPLDLKSKLKPGESLIFFGKFGGGFPAIWDGKDNPADQTGGDFTADEKKLLLAAARKILER